MRMLDNATIAAIAEELAEADRSHSVIPRITARYPEATIEDSYAIQGVWREQNIDAGRRLVGRKIGLTSKAMQQATGITEPDYGVMFEDTVYRSGAEIPVDLFSNVRIEVELAFVLKEPLEGPDCTSTTPCSAIDYAVPALEVLNSHIELEGRTIVDTISDNAAYGAMVLGDVHKRPDEIDLRWVPGVLSRNGEIEETGVAAGVLGHPASGVAWLANKFHHHGARLEAGEIILAGSFTRPMWVHRGDTVHADYGPNWGPSHVASSSPDLPRGAARGIPPAGRHLDLLRQSRSSPRSAPAPAWTGCSSTWSTPRTASNRSLPSCRLSPAYPVTPVVRVPIGDIVHDQAGSRPRAQNLLIPMVSSVAEARAAAVAPSATRRMVGAASDLRSRGRRGGIGSPTTSPMRTRTFRSSSRSKQRQEWMPLRNIAAVDGVDGVFVGPSDLAASMGLLGQQKHPEVTAAVRHTFDAVRGAGKPVGVNAFDPVIARSYLDAGASFVLVGADVVLLARGSEALAAQFTATGSDSPRTSY